MNIREDIIIDFELTSLLKTDTRLLNEFYQEGNESDYLAYIDALESDVKIAVTAGKITKSQGLKLIMKYEL